MPPRKVLVVGGAGYIGSHVVHDLLQHGYEPVVFDNFSANVKVELPCVDIIKGDLLNQEDIDRACKGMDAVVHLAAKKDVAASVTQPMEFAKTNISGTLNLISACQTNKIDVLVFSSSAAVYGNPQQTPISEDHPTVPESFYGSTKLTAEQMLEWSASLKCLRYVSLRYFNAVGASDTFYVRERGAKNLFPVLLDAAVNPGAEVKVYGTDWDTPDGTAIRDYVHVEDLAAAHRMALEYLWEHLQCSSLTLNLGTGRGVSVKEAIDAVMKVTDTDLIVVSHPRRTGDCSVSIADASKAYRVLGWKAKHVCLEDVVKSMWRWRCL